MSQPDPLFDLRTFFWLGNYQAGINAGTRSKIQTDAQRLERDVYMYRCYIEQANYPIVLEEIAENHKSKALLAVRLLAQFTKEKSNGGNIVQINENFAPQLEALLSEEYNPEEDDGKWLQIIGGILYNRMGLLEKAFKTVFNSPTLEARALILEIYLRLNRVDLAEAELKNIQSQYDYAIPTLLASAWLNILLGGERSNDALYTYQELLDKYGPSVPLLNGFAMALINLKRFDDAEKSLLEALEKNPKSAETLANLVVVYAHQKKGADLINRTLLQLKQVDANHPSITTVKNFEEEFQKQSARFAL
jgi:tetratricopeptide (TPR) repeat protein